MKTSKKWYFFIGVGSLLLFLFCSCRPPLAKSEQCFTLKKRVVDRCPENVSDQYTFSKYKHNAQIEGSRIVGTGWTAELSLEEVEARGKKYNINNADGFIEFSFNGEYYLFLGCNRGFSPIGARIYGGDKYEKWIQSFHTPIEAAIFSLSYEGRSFLVVYLQKEELTIRSPSSTLFLLDDEFRELYREDLSKDPYWCHIGLFQNDTGEECFFVGRREGKYVVYQLAEKEPRFPFGKLKKKKTPKQ